MNTQSAFAGDSREQVIGMVEMTLCVFGVVWCGVISSCAQDSAMNKTRP